MVYEVLVAYTSFIYYFIVLWAVVNNAGIGHAGEIDWTPIEELRKVHNVNADGTLRVTKTFLSLIKKSRGRIINNASICGKILHHFSASVAV